MAKRKTLIIDTDAFMRLLNERDPRVTKWPTCDDCSRGPECLLVKNKATAAPLFGCCRNWRGGALEPGLGALAANQKAETCHSRCATVLHTMYSLMVGDDD